MKRRPAFSVAIIVCCLGLIGGVAHAQVSVTVTSTVAISVSPGDNISNAGSFTVNNNSGSGITISAVTISASDPGIFSSLSLTGQVPGSTQVVVQSSPNPPSTSNTFNFPSLPVLLNGQTATFSLSGVASAATATPTPTSSSTTARKVRLLYAALISPGQPKMPALMLSALAFGMLLMTGRLRRRHLIVLAMALIMAATEVGCGNTNNGVTGTSSQVVQTITASSGGSPTGLPASLGSITVQ